MRVAVMGGGAMGGAFGAHLAAAGTDVLLVDVAPPVVDAVRRHGLRLVVDGDERNVPLKVTDAPADERPADVVVFFVKNYHTESAARLAAPLVDDATTVVSLQNGWGNGDVLARAFDPARLVVGVTYHSATVLEPGRVAHTGKGRTVVGPYDGGSLERAERVAEALRTASFEVDATPEVRTEIWKKLTLNAATLPTAALTRLTAGALGQPGPMLELVDAVAGEAVATANAAGLAIELDERVETIHAVLERAGAGKASMLQDVEAGRRTEIEVITGAVVRAAREHGVAVPLNEALYALVTGLERGLGLR